MYKWNIKSFKFLKVLSSPWVRKQEDKRDEWPDGWHVNAPSTQAPSPQTSVSLMASLIIWGEKGRRGGLGEGCCCGGEQIVPWTGGGISAEDVNQSYYPLTRSGCSSFPWGTKKWATDRLQLDITKWGVLGESLPIVLSWNINMDVSFQLA